MNSCSLQTPWSLVSAVRDDASIHAVGTSGAHETSTRILSDDFDQVLDKDQAGDTDYEYSDDEYPLDEIEDGESDDMGEEAAAAAEDSSASKGDFDCRKCPPIRVASDHDKKSVVYRENKRPRQEAFPTTNSSAVATTVSYSASLSPLSFVDDDAFFYNVKDFACPLCTAHVEGGDGVILPDCQHSICVDCLQQYVQVQIEEGFPQVSATNQRGGGNKRIDTSSLISCPTCSLPIHRRVLAQMLPSELQVLLQRSSCSYVVANDPSYHHCPTPNCDNVVYWKNGIGPPVADCFQCQKTACLQCGTTPYHTAYRTCQAYRESMTNSVPSRSSDNLTDGYIASIRGRKCNKCSAVIIKESGCNKMKCRCGYRFCFRCGTEDAHCACTPTFHGFVDNVRGSPDFPGMVQSWATTRSHFRQMAGPPSAAAAAVVGVPSARDARPPVFAFLPFPQSQPHGL